MNPTHTELRLLRWPLLRLASALLAALALTMFSLYFMRESARQADAAEQNAARIRGETQRLQSEEQDMRARIAEYQAIEARGVIGSERRMDWVDLMRSIQRERKLLGLEYEIQPSRPLQDNPAGKNGTGYIFMNSIVKVQIPLLHEDDLLHFLDDVNANAAALTRLRSCKLQRSVTLNPAQGQMLPPQLMAECQMDWITLVPEGVKK